MQERSRVEKFLREYWPIFYRLLNTAFYSLISLLKTFVRLAIEQIKGLAQ